MAYPRSFLRLTLTGQLPGGEVWNTSCAWDASSPIVSLDTDTAAALSAKATAFWVGPLNDYVSAGVKFTGSYVTWVAPDGHALARIDDVVSPLSGTDASNPLPNEVSLVLSLATSLAGRRTRGRMYLPPPGVGNIGADGRYTSSILTSLATGAATLLGTFTVGAVEYTSVVASATGSLLTPIDTVKVGNVPDAQRRRRDTLIEAYTSHAVS